ncbi:hypothetical protein HV124_21475 [Enterobacter asburiae]|uniref:hypothetical protein n=1 Tax=Enterobacter asburiae TaxID=61645 RepID=UPI0015F88453|nr:hypothetical protein [Enterobacter asburiae]MBA7988543.1 hypothetical protein [Enterobacter asburiae]
MSFLNMVARGNIKRIKELHQLGQRPDAIVQRFAQYGLNISESFVNCIINGEFDELDRIAVPRQVVNDLERELDELSRGIMPA